MYTTRKCILGILMWVVLTIISNKVITADAVATSIDLGIYICAKLVGKEKAALIARRMDYNPQQFEILVINNEDNRIHKHNLTLSLQTSV
jgi:hypothetical protein